VLVVEAMSSSPLELNLWLLVMKQVVYEMAVNVADFACYTELVADKNHCRPDGVGQMAHDLLDYIRDSECNHVAYPDLAAMCLVVVRDMVARGEMSRIEEAEDMAVENMMVGHILAAEVEEDQDYVADIDTAEDIEEASALNMLREVVGNLVVVGNRGRSQKQAEERISLL
jgi:hypothetical protein